MNVAILGGGSWGTALAVHLAGKNHQVKVWEFFVEQAKEMQKKRICKLLPDVYLPKGINVSSEMKVVIPDSELVLLAVPSSKAEITISQAQKFLAQQPIVICSKGFASDLRLLSDVVQKKVSGKVYCLYGPTHAEEVSKGLFSGVILAGEASRERERIREAFHSNTLKVYSSDDLIGVQVSAALKNILAVMVGVMDGKGLGDNAKAFMMTAGLGEIKQIGLKLGAKEETFYGLAGMGDVIVTCTSQHSRNRYVGEQVGKGRKLDEIIKEMSMVAEGVDAVKQAVQFQRKLKLKLPIITGLHDILFAGKNVEEVLTKL